MTAAERIAERRAAIVKRTAEQVPAALERLQRERERIAEHNVDFVLPLSQYDLLRQFKK